jgi:hypothetical protein
MEAKRKRTQAYELLLEVASVPLAERAQIMIGAELFFDQGWPINHFTVGMAARAGGGIIPPVYKGLGSEERYFHALRIRPNPAEYACHLTERNSVASDTRTGGSSENRVQSPCGIDTRETEA